MVLLRGHDLVGLDFSAFDMLGMGTWLFGGIKEGWELKFCFVR